MTSSFYDPEFGEIIIKRSARSSAIRLRVGTDGRYAVSAPTLTPLFLIKQVVRSSRDQLRAIAEHTSHARPYVDGQLIGHSHRLAVVPTHMVSEPKVQIKRQTLVVLLPPDSTLSAPTLQQQIRDAAATILRKEAKSYLPSRLRDLAQANDFSFERIRFSHSGGRWGSYSSNGTISLNIALMKLPAPLIDYVLIHELCHTRHMDHSVAFWREVRRYDPLYRQHKEQLRRETPSV